MSFYLIEVLVALLLGLALIPPWRRGRRVDWPPETAWRGFLVCIGWFVFVVATMLWAFIVWLVFEAWIDSMNPDLPKRASLLFLIFGGLVFLTLAGFAGTAFHASSGSARSDIMARIGRREN